jgi:NADH-ubiquinone oxidoreductase chain 3
MTSTTFFFIFIPIVAILLLLVNILLAPHNPYQEKDSVFECGFHSFLGQNRTQFSISFFIFALLFLLFDLEILLIYPYSVSSYNNDIYGLIILILFFILLTMGFIYELGKNALTIDSRQISAVNKDLPKPYGFTKGDLKANLASISVVSKIVINFGIISKYLPKSKVNKLTIKH